MTRVLAPVLSSSDLPLAELCAARIDGEVFAIDECFAPVDTVETPALRGASLLTVAGRRSIAVLESALWLHGLCSEPPGVHQLRVLRRERARLPLTRRLAAGEAQFDDLDLCVLGGMRVTTIDRTIVDLLLADEFGEHRARLVRAAFDADATITTRCARRIASAEHLPGKRRALRRLQTLAAGQPALTRYTS